MVHKNKCWKRGQTSVLSSMNLYEFEVIIVITFSHFSQILATFPHFPSLFPTFHHFSPLFPTFHHYSPLFTMFHHFSPLSLLLTTFRHFSSLLAISDIQNYRKQPFCQKFPKKIKLRIDLKWPEMRVIWTMFEPTAGWLQLGINIYIQTDSYVGNEGIYIVFTL